MTTRTDIHRPSAIIPENYVFIGVQYLGTKEDIGEALFFRAEMQRIEEHRAETGGKYSNHNYGGTCHVCGATAMYLAVYYHPNTNVYIRMGDTCSDKLEFGDAAYFRAAKKAGKDYRTAKAGKMKAVHTLTEAGHERALALLEMSEAKLEELHLIEKRYFAQDNTKYTVYDCYELSTIRDIVGKLVKYGSISDKQMAFLGKLIEDCDGRKEKMEARAKAEAKRLENAKPVPEERVQVTGTVVSVREPDQYAMYPAWKMLVLDDEGFKVWGSVPRAFDVEGLKGSRVTFKATLTPSPDDKYFGFFKRPAKGEIVKVEDE